ncbi:hypothetical protein [Clostridium sp. JN-1]|uniref:hypothetical protein n=1 Tax=Clostridium sp. JN-1 TaxID=2483110 RepID=UPI000F0B038C|nr:hypothetical protein [Clostridium sp. JN-1]
MKNVLNKLSYYFRESYGIDKLSTHLYIGGLILSLFKHTAALGFVFFIYATWRCLSKNKYKRYNELQAYENFILPIAKRFSKFKYSMNDHKYYKIFKCPNCSQKLRVPKHKGRITITCNACGTSFKKKS